VSRKIMLVFAGNLKVGKPIVFFLSNSTQIYSRETFIII